MIAALALVVFVATVGLHGGRAASLEDTDAGDIAEAASYLAKYGYSSSSPTADRSSALMSLADEVAQFQRFANLKVTGELDAETLAKMREPRCGVKDKLGPSYRARRRKRYALQGSRWRIRNLKYKITNWPSKLTDKLGIKKAISDSFKVWADVSSLTFEEVGPSEKANIDIKFASKEHGDGDPFDGRGGTLAHAFFPLYGGDAHFDDDEPWIVSGRHGIDLFMTAAHEFGHSLGLSHTKDSKALMAPFYRPPSSSRDVIHEDDKLAIQELYGAPSKAVAPVEPKSSEGDTTTNPKNDPILCSDSSVDAIITASNERTYVFKGDSYWRLTETGIEHGYPLKISDKWDGIPDDLDAAFVWASANRIYFFKGSQYWRMTNFKLDIGYPKQISEGFPGIPDNWDAAFQWKANGMLFFFKGDQYWKFEPNQTPPVNANKYPRPISVWGGIPDNIDSVFTYSNKKTYFFKDDVYYRYDDIKFRVMEAEIPYPRSTGRWWFGCDNKPSSMVTPSSRRGDIAADGLYGDAEVGFGGGKAQPRRTPGAAAALLPSLTLLLVTAALAVLRS